MNIFYGPQGGVFAPYTRPWLTYSRYQGMGEFDFSATEASATVPWLEITRFDQGTIEFGLTEAANALPVGVHEGNIRLAIPGQRPFLHPVVIYVGAPNDDFDAPTRLSGTHVLGVGSQEGSTPDPEEEAVFGTDSQAGFGSIWWRWTAPQTGYYYLRSMDQERNRTRQAVELFRGTSIPSLVPVTGPSVCSQRDFDVIFCYPLALRFHAEAGEVFTVRARGNSRRLVTFNIDAQLGDNNLVAERAREIGGSHVSALINGTPYFGSCEYDPFGIPMAGTDEFWFRWTAETTGEHGIWLEPTGTRPEFVQRSRGQITVYDASGNTVLTDLEISPSDQHVEDTAFFDAVANEAYLVRIISRGHADILQIRDFSGIHPPANDDLSSATVVDGGAARLSVNMRFATREAFEADQLGAGVSVWWRWTAPFDGGARFSVRDSYYGSRWPGVGANVAVFRGLHADALERVALSAPERELWPPAPHALYIPVEAGETYYFRGDGFASSRFYDEYLFAYGDYVLDFDSGTRPANDSFQNAQTVTGLRNSVAGSNVYATEEPGEPQHGGFTDFMSDPEELSV